MTTPLPHDPPALPDHPPSPMDMVGRGPAPTVGTHGPHDHTPRDVVAVREIFWHNVIREMLTALSAMVIERHLAPYDPATEKVMQDTFDGRMAVITMLGQRIPIAEVHPLFACSVATSPRSRALSMEVQCTVFQIRTPTGEIYTIPLHEIRCFHALTPDLMQQMEKAAQRHSRNGDDAGEPFGFAAFTSLAQSEMVHEDETIAVNEHEPIGHPPVGPGLGSMPSLDPGSAGSD